MHHGRLQLSVVLTGPLRERGYTLAELLVGAVISLIALSAFLGFNRMQLYAFSNQTSQLDLQTAGRSLIDLFTREVRMAGMDPTCSKSFSGISSASATQIEIKSDLNADGTIDGTNEDIVYTYNATDHAIERTANGTTTPLTDSRMSVGSSMLAYYDGSGNPLVPAGTGGPLTQAQCDSVRRVQLVLTLQAAAADPLNSLPLAATFSSNVDLRNRFFLASTVCP